jgi:transcription elongation factor Elf1
METETREPSFETCPFCGCKDRHVVKVQSDHLGLSHLFMECQGCGTSYVLERVVSWQAQKITCGKSLYQEVTEFLEDRTQRIVKAKCKLAAEE